MLCFETLLLALDFLGKNNNFAGFTNFIQNWAAYILQFRKSYSYFTFSVCIVFANDLFHSFFTLA